MLLEQTLNELESERQKSHRISEELTRHEDQLDQFVHENNMMTEELDALRSQHKKASGHKDAEVQDLRSRSQEQERQLEELVKEKTGLEFKVALSHVRLIH